MSSAVCRMPDTPAFLSEQSSTFAFTATPGSALDTPAAAAPSPTPLPTVAAGAAPQKENNSAAAQGGLGVADEMPHVPIDSLNPYKGKWTIRAKVDRKQPLRSSVVKGEQTSILTVVLVDQSVRAALASFPRMVVCTLNAHCAFFRLVQVSTMYMVCIQVVACYVALPWCSA